MIDCVKKFRKRNIFSSILLKDKHFAGEAVCRPISGSLIAELFEPSSRGLANGIFSWGVYYGYGLAYVIGIYLTQVIILKVKIYTGPLNTSFSSRPMFSVTDGGHRTFSALSLDL